MTNVLKFPERKPVAAPAPQTPAPDAVDEMFKASAAMTLIATLSFYASQGWDGGKKARAALPALKQLMATKGIELVVPQ